MTVAAVIGAGPGAGFAIARRFAQEGYGVAVARRDADALAPLVGDIEALGGRAKAYGLDAADEAGVDAFFEAVEHDLGPLTAMIYNPARFLRASALEMSAADYRGLWETIALGGFLAGRAAGRRFALRGEGFMLFTGATASVKASSHFAGFAAAKHALRATALSLAKELGPRGVHVAHLIIDGVIDTPAWRAAAPDMIAQLGEDGLVSPEAIAQAVWALARQPKRGWTFEMDMRPSKETW